MPGPRPARCARPRRAGPAAAGPRGRGGWSRRPSASKNRSGGPGSVTVPERRVLHVDRAAPGSASGPTRRPRRGCAPCRPARRPRRAGPAGARRPSRRRPPRRPRWCARARRPGRALVSSPGVAGSMPNPSHRRFHRPSLPTAICTAPSRQWNRPYGAMRRVVVALRAADLAGHRPARALEGVHPDDRRQQGGAHDLPAPGGRPLVQRGDDAVRAVHPGEQVADRYADPLRVVGTGAGERHQAGLALGDLVVAGAPALGAVVAEAGDREHHERAGCAP